MKRIETRNRSSSENMEDGPTSPMVDELQRYINMVAIDQTKGSMGNEGNSSSSSGSEEIRVNSSSGSEDREDTSETYEESSNDEWELEGGAYTMCRPDFEKYAKREAVSQ